MALAWKKLPGSQTHREHSWEGLAAGNTLRVKRRRGLDWMHLSLKGQLPS